MPTPIEDFERHLQRLPPFPQAAARALEELGSDSVDFTRIDHVIGSDPILTARILRIANSPFYGLPGKIAAIRDACMLTGTPTLRNLIVASVAMSQFQRAKTSNTDRGAFWRHSAQCAAFAAELATVTRQPRDAAFTAGLLHDIGKLALDALVPDDYARVHEHGGTLDAETSVLGITHAEIGARVAQLWRLPPSIRDAIAGHHAPEPAARATLADVVHAADVLTHAVSDGQDGTAAWSRVNAETCMRLNLGADEREALFARGKSLASTAAELFTGT